MEVESQRELTGTPCPCQSGASFPQLLEISLKAGASLSALMSLDTQISSLLLSIRACNQCSNDAQLIQDAFSALKNVLVLLEAEESVYIPTSRTHGSYGRPSSQGPSLGLSEDSQSVTLKETFTFGSIILDDYESTMIAKRLIRDSALRIGRNLRWISVKCRTIHDLDHFNQEIKTTINRIKIIIARTA